jgi:DNA polymerase (family 10)
MDNLELAQHLFDHAHDLNAEGGNLYRVRAYRVAAQTVMELDEPVTALLDRGGLRELEALPGIGSHVGRTIESLIRTGHVPPRDGATGPAAA